MFDKDLVVKYTCFLKIRLEHKCLIQAFHGFSCILLREMIVKPETVVYDRV